MVDSLAERMSHDARSSGLFYSMDETPGDYSKIPLDSDILRRFFRLGGPDRPGPISSRAGTEKGLAWNDELLPTLKKRK